MRFTKSLALARLEGFWSTARRPTFGLCKRREERHIDLVGRNLANDVFEVRHGESTFRAHYRRVPQTRRDHPRKPASIEPLLVGLLNRLHIGTAGKPARTPMLEQGPKTRLERGGVLGGIRPTLPFEEDSPQCRFPPQHGNAGAIEEDAIHRCAVGLSHGHGTQEN
jgi:hypothetical protein